MDTVIALAVAAGVLVVLFTIVAVSGHRKITREVKPRADELADLIAGALAKPFTRPLIEDALDRCGLPIPNDRKELSLMCTDILTEAKFRSIRYSARASTQMRILEEELEMLASIDEKWCEEAENVKVEPRS
jgi:hypothetical protein